MLDFLKADEMGFHLLSEIGSDKAIYKEDQFAKVDTYYVPTIYFVVLSFHEYSRLWRQFSFSLEETKNFKTRCAIHVMQILHNTACTFKNY